MPHLVLPCAHTVQQHHKTNEAKEEKDVNEHMSENILVWLISPTAYMYMSVAVLVGHMKA